MKKIIALLAVAAIALTAFAGCGSDAGDQGGSSADSTPKTIKMSGSTSMEELAKGFSEAYGEKTGATITVEVGGSSVGFKNVAEGVSDIGNCLLYTSQCDDQRGVGGGPGGDHH